MKAKLIYLLLAALAVLGGLNVFQSLQDRLRPHEEYIAVEHVDFDKRQTVHREKVVASFPVDDDAGGEVVIDKRFKVKPGERLLVEVPHTDVVIETGTGDEAHIRLTLDGSDMKRAREVFEEMDFRIEQTGDAVRVTATSPRGGWSRDDVGGAEFDLLIRIPTRFNVEIATSHGDLVLADLEGEARVRTSHGDLEAGRLQGNLLHLQTSHGDLSAHRLSGEVVHLQTSHGDLAAREVVATRFEAYTSHGDIALGDVETAGLKARTSHADLRIGRLEGRADLANAHGDIEVFMVKPAEATLQTSHGDIHLSFPESFAADIDLRGERVHLDGAGPFSGDLEKDRARGRLGRGGPPITARTSHGRVTLAHH
ncbi:MAG: hypothetical protein KatS3mg043_1808 [Rhodothermaceae bacterium]|nr:MAG: hypothetical protein KatS3mg043_1808 [Rhodothermaceae bacterium]